MGNNEELGLRLNLALKRLHICGINHRRHFNSLTEEHYPHSSFNFRLSFENEATLFTVHDDGGTGEYEPIASCEKLDNLAEEVVLTLERAADYFEGLQPVPEA